MKDLSNKCGNRAAVGRSNFMTILTRPGVDGTSGADTNRSIKPAHYIDQSD